MLVGAEAWVSSRDEIHVSNPTGLEVAQPSVSPEPGATLSVSPSAGCQPTTLSIGKINVDTHVLAVGIDSAGRQSVPNNPTDVSWWRDGSLPGQPGNAVFAGHTWSQGDGVFDRLSELNAGDLVVVHGKGCALTFAVTTVSRHVPVNLSSKQVEELYATSGPSGLVLITCGDYSNGEYHSRIVVEANLSE